MEDQFAEIRRRVLVEASLLTHDEWTRTVRNFYRIVLAHHPRLAVHFSAVNGDSQVQKLVALLTTLARDLPDRTTLDRVVFQMGTHHVALGIRHREFSEFVALLARILASSALARQDEAYAVWYQELSAIAGAMLLTAS